MKLRSLFSYLLLSLSTISLWNNAYANPFEELYEKAKSLHVEGDYHRFIRRTYEDPKLMQAQAEYLVTILEDAKKLSSTERQTMYQEIFYYYSQKHQGFKKAASGVVNHLSISLDQFAQGNYDSRQMAHEMISGTLSFEHNVILPLLSQIEREIVSQHGDVNLFVIGRDFSVASVYLRARRKIKPDHVFNLNISRRVRDAVVDGGQVKELSHILQSIGLTKEVLLKRPILFIDSSMKGKIPRALMLAMIEDMDAQSALQFLSSTSIKYVRAKQAQTQQTIADQFKALADSGNKVTKEQIVEMLKATPTLSIPIFQLALPNNYQWHPEHLHNIFEHRYKFLQTTEGFAKSDAGNIVFDVPAPKTAALQARSILGMFADISIYNMAKRERPISAEQLLSGQEIKVEEKPSDEDAAPKEDSEVNNTEETKVEDSPPPEEVKETAFLRMAKYLQEKGYATDLRNIFNSMQAWTSQVTEESKTEIIQVKIAETHDEAFPFVLEHRGKPIYRLRKFIGEGHNVRVYLTEHGTALKVLKNYKNAQKQKLHQWTQPILEDYKIPLPRLINVEENGMYIETDYISGDSLEYSYGFGKDPLPDSLREQIIGVWKNAIRMANETGIYLDLKAANFHVNRRGHVVFVDSVPRLNKGYWNYYYQNNKRTPLSEEEFLERFLHHDINQGNAVRIPEGKKYERKQENTGLQIGQLLNLWDYVKSYPLTNALPWHQNQPALVEKSAKELPHWTKKWAKNSFASQPELEQLKTILRDTAIDGIDIGDIGTSLQWDGSEWSFLYTGEFERRVATDELLQKYENGLFKRFAEALKLPTERHAALREAVRLR